MSKKLLASAAYDFPKSFKDLIKNVNPYYVPEPEVLQDDQIIVINNFFSKDLCQELIKSFESQLKLETTPLIKSKEYAARYNDRASITDAQAADVLWRYIKHILLASTNSCYEGGNGNDKESSNNNEGEDEDNDNDDDADSDADADSDCARIRRIFSSAVGLNPQLRVYRYTQGHHFGAHYDESVTCPIPLKGKQMGKTGWTLLIYLTGGEEFVGGGTIFHPEFHRGKQISDYINIHPSKGMALLHKHGDSCLKHEAEIVRRGVKWVLRSDVVYPI